MSQQFQSTPIHKRRYPYTSVACEKCQRRKIKCSGGQPCQKCRDSGAQCHYSRTTRFRHAPRASIDSGHPSSIGTSTATNAATATNKNTDAASDTVRKSSHSGSESRPGSFDYYLRLAETRFAEATAVQTDKPATRTQSHRFSAVQMKKAVDYRNDPSKKRTLDVFDMDTWIDMLQTYDDGIGLQYPFLDLNQLIRRITDVKRGTPDRVRESSASQNGETMTESIVLLVLAVITGFVDSSAVEVARPLVEEVFGSVITKTFLNTPDKDDLTLLILVSIFFFLSDQEFQAWRTIGTVMRLLQELSSTEAMNESYFISPEFFWTVYTLDRRWCFGTSLPFAVPDAAITHPSLPAASDDSFSSAYLKQMVIYSRLSSEIRTSVLESTSTCLTTLQSARDFATFRVTQWQNNLPTRLQFRGIQDKFDPLEEKRGHYRLRLMLYLRANQMKTIVLRKSATRWGPENFDASCVQTMAAAAQDTIRVLVGLSRDTDIYQAQHRTFNHFLETALSSLLLVLCCTESTESQSCLGDVVAAMDLVRQLSKQSSITQKLGDRLRGVQRLIDAVRAKSLGTTAVAPQMNSAGTRKGAKERRYSHAGELSLTRRDIVNHPPGSSITNPIDLPLRDDAEGAIPSPWPSNEDANRQLHPSSIPNPNSLDSYLSTNDCPPFATDAISAGVDISPHNPILDGSSPESLGYQLPSGFTLLQDMVFSLDDSEMLRQDLSEILMDYENFSF